MSEPAFIIDCSVAMSWCFADEATAETTQLLHRLESEAALVPALWYLEVTNVLALAERKGRITPAAVAAFIGDIEALDIQVDLDGPGRAFSHLLPLCRAHRLTSYDALYLDLALRRQYPIATLDQELRTACKALGIEVTQPNLRG